MKNRHGIILYALEEIPHPGSHEIRVRPAPSGLMIRNERGEADGQSQGR
ncbi:MAG: hypothetical protein IKK34_13350 [Clostridia bacterium]|nr:hypothetical protein [Clostridia bacterium]